MSEDIKNLVAGIEKSFHALKEEQNQTKGKVDALSELKIDKQVEEITKGLDALQKSQAKIEAAMSRPSADEQKDNMEAEHAKAFNDFMRDGSEKGSIEIMQKAMSTDVNPDGGYLVRPALSNFVVNRVFETSPLRQVARVETIGTKSIEVLIDDNEAGARWIGEGASSGETDTPQLGLKEIVAHKLEADPKITIEQIQDSYLDVEAWLQGKVADKFARTENSAFVSGNGVLKPRGFLTYAARADNAVYERDAIAQINMGSAAALNADGLIDVQNSLKEAYQGRAVWGMQRNTYGDALKLKGNDNYFFGQTLLKDGQLQAQLLGKQVIFMDDMPAVAANALSVVYADFSMAYTIVDRVGLIVLKDPYTNKGFMTYYTTKRTGGDVTSFDAISIGKVAS